MSQKGKTIDEKIIQEVIKDPNIEIKHLDKGRDGNKFLVKTSKGDELFCRIRKKEGESIIPYQEEIVLNSIQSSHIIKPIISDIIRNRYILVRHFVRGRDLGEVLKGNRKLSNEEIRKLAKVLFETAKSLAKIDAIHLDIKPANIICSEDSEYKLVDFGAARFLSKMHNVRLHPGRAYIAPEVLRYLFDQTTTNLHDISILSDMYSIGGVLYTAATGINFSEFFKTSSDLLQNTPPPVRYFRKDIGPILSDIIDKLVSKEPARRPHPNDLALLLSGKRLKTKEFPLYFLKSKPRGEHSQMIPIINYLKSFTGIYWYSESPPNFNPRTPTHNILWETPPRSDIQIFENDLMLQYTHGVIGFCVPGFELDTPYDSKIIQKI